MLKASGRGLVIGCDDRIGCGGAANTEFGSLGGWVEMWGEEQQDRSSRAPLVSFKFQWRVYEQYEPVYESGARRVGDAQCHGTGD